MAGSPVEEIKLRLDVLDVVGPHVALKRSGRSQKGLCPFHAEKTPSFYVFPETGTWKCFGCGEGGDVFSFVQKRENLDFGEALRMLAGNAGVELPSRESRPPEAQALEDRLGSLLATAELFFKGALHGTAGAAARAYLQRREVSEEMIQRFGLGYAPAGGLLRKLKESGFRPEEAVEAGLAGRRDEESVFEMFRERLIFPIRDQNGRTIAFGGRTLGEGQPKYLNGPQTRFFDKSGCLFALDLARGAIRQSGQAIIVEGYLDAILAHQCGSENAVATLGTALTERHLELLGRRAKEIVLALDADSAGQAATLRGLEVARNAPADDFVPVPTPGVRGLIRYQSVRKTQLKVLTMPAGLDPDELIRSDSGEWARLVGEATPVVDFLLSRLGERHDLASAGGKREAVQEAVSVIRDIIDPVEREHYLQRLASLVRVDESALRQALSRVFPRTRSTREPSAPLDESRELPETYALALSYLVTPDTSSLSRDDLGSTQARAIFELFSSQQVDPRDEASLLELADSAEPALRRHLVEVGAWLSRLAHLSPEQRGRELEVAALKLRQDRLRTEHGQVMALLSEPDSAEANRPNVSVLANIAAQLREIEAALAARDGIGSVVWRSRQVGEVIRG